MTNKGGSGFTLLEVLVALMVLALLVVSLAQGSHLALTAWGTQARLVDKSSTLDSVDRTLRNVIAQMEPSSRVGPISISGRANALSFISALPSAKSDLLTRRVDMTLRLDSAHRLVLQWAPHWHVERTGPAPAAEETVLLGSVGKLELGYWSAGTWQDEWHARTPPRLVRVRVQFLSGDARRWSDLIIAPVRIGVLG